MANAKISDITTSTTTLATTHLFEVETGGGTSEKMTGTVLAAFNRAQTASQLVAGSNITLTPGSSGATATMTIASSGGSSAARHPGYRSAARYRFGNFGVASVAQNAGNLLFLPMIVESNVTLTGCDMSISVIDAGNPGILVGIYNSSATTFKPTTMVTGASVTLSAAVISATTTRYVAFASPITLTAGFYWRAVLFQGAPTCISLAASDALTASIFGTDSATAPSTGYNCWLASAYGYGTGLPADATSSPSLVLSAAQAAIPLFVAQ